MTHADQRFDREGFQYGVRFADGGVLARWNGPTQRQRAEAEAARIVVRQRAWLEEHGWRRDPDLIVPVRHRDGEPWETYGDDPWSDPAPVAGD